MPIRRLDEVFVPEGRIRRSFDPARHAELVASILSKGLLHPPVVEDSGALLAGERRLRALREISEAGKTYHCNGKWIAPHLIFTTDIRELSATDRLEAELEENTIRVDISWQEKAEATAALHTLRLAQAAEATMPGLAPPEHVRREVAAEIRGKAPEEVSRSDMADVRADLLVQTWLSNHPDDTEVSGAKSRADALKVIETKLSDEHRSALARRFLSSRSDSGHILQKVDLLLALANTPEGVYDCICTDPPWGVGADQWTNGDSIRQHSYLDDMATFDKIHLALAQDGFRVCKPKAHIYLFCDFAKFERLMKLFRSFGWDVWPRPLIWWRGRQVGLAPRPEHGPKQTYECILFANKGNKRVLELRPDVLLYPPASGDLVRAAAKPVGVYHDLLSRSVLPGDEVLDPCCGSGPILPAANALRCRATCYDIADDAIGLASQRLTEAFEPQRIEINERSSTSRAGVATRRPGVVA